MAEERPGRGRINKPKVIVHLQGISKSFPGVRALSHVDLTIKAGEVHLARDYGPECKNWS